MTCTVTDKAGGSCQGVKPDGQRCNKVLYPPHSMPHVARMEAHPDSRGGMVLEPELYCDDCCPAHRGQQPLTTTALVDWLRRANPGTLSIRGWVDERGPTLVVVERIREKP
jgi:hypothetical protein